MLEKIWRILISQKERSPKSPLLWDTSVHVFLSLSCFYSMCVFRRSVVSDSLQPSELQPTRLLCPWGISRQEYWSELLCPPPGDLPNPRIEPRSPILQADSLPSEPPGKPFLLYTCMFISTILGSYCVSVFFFSLHNRLHYVLLKNSLLIHVIFIILEVSLTHVWILFFPISGDDKYDHFLKCQVLIA